MTNLPIAINRFICFIFSLKNNIQPRLPLLALLVPVALYGCNDSSSSTPPSPKTLPAFQTDGIAEKATDILGMKMRHSKPQLAFNQQGDGMSVWTAETGKGLMLMYSLFDVSTQSWSKEGVVANIPYINNSEYIQKDKTIIASDGTSFGVVWQFENQVYVRIYNMGKNAQWSEATQISQIRRSTSLSLQASIAAIPGQGYAVAWRASTDVYVTLLNGQNLVNTPYKVFSIAPLLPPGGTAVSHSNDTYELLPILDRFSVLTGYSFKSIDIQLVYTPHVLFRSYDSSSSTWSEPITLNEPNNTGILSHLVAVSGVNGAAITWRLSPNSTNYSIAGEAILFANILHVGALWEWDLPVQLGSIDQVDVSDNSFDLSAANNSYGVIWKRTTISDIAPISATVFTNIYSESNKKWQPKPNVIAKPIRTDVNIANNGSTYVATYADRSKSAQNLLYATTASETNSLWKNPIEINPSQNRIGNFNAKIVSNGANFISVATNLSSNSASTSIEANIISITTAGNLESSAADSLLVDGVDDFNLSIAGGRLWFLGGQETGHSPAQKFKPPVVLDFDESSQNWNNPTYLIQDDLLTSAVVPQMISNDKANSMLTWYQFNGGKYDLYANFRIDGKWNEPVFVYSSRIVRNRVIASFFSGYDTFTRIFSNYAAFVLNDQFAIVWFDRKGLYTRIFDNGVGRDVETLAKVNYTTVYGFSQLSTFNTNAGLKVCWADENSPRDLDYACKTYENQQWSTSIETFSPDTTGPVNESKLTVNRRGDIGITWIVRNKGATGNLYDIYAQAKIDGVLDDVKQLNDITSTGVELVNAAFDSDNNLAIAWRQTVTDPTTQNRSNKTYVSIFSPNQQWTTHERRTIQYSLAFLASNTSGFALARVDSDTIYMDIYENGVWSQSQAPLPYYDNTPYNNAVKYQLMGKNGTFTLYWPQLNENAAFNIYASTFRATTEPTQPASILNLPAVNPQDRLEPHLSSYRDGFALTWSQFDPIDDPARSKIWTKMGGILPK